MVAGLHGFRGPVQLLVALEQKLRQEVATTQLLQMVELLVLEAIHKLCHAALE